MTKPENEKERKLSNFSIQSLLSRSVTSPTSDSGYSSSSPSPLHTSVDCYDEERTQQGDSEKIGEDFHPKTSVSSMPALVNPMLTMCYHHFLTTMNHAMLVQNPGAFPTISAGSWPRKMLPMTKSDSMSMTERGLIMANLLGSDRKYRSLSFLSNPAKHKGFNSSHVMCGCDPYFKN